jgi:aryl-alcohol dehydrogenase-like predicted oxidoreductase
MVPWQNVLRRRYLPSRKAATLTMEMRRLGSSGLHVSALGFGTTTFGGDDSNPVGTTQVDEARSLIDFCLEVGVNVIDSADVYSQGASEKVLGQALKGRRDDVILATKVHGLMGSGPNDIGQSRHHIAASWKMTPEEVQRLDEVSAVPPIYPYWHQRRNNTRVPQPTNLI